jgi:hypothetical protein
MPAFYQTLSVQDVSVTSGKKNILVAAMVLCLRDIQLFAILDCH